MFRPLRNSPLPIVLVCIAVLGSADRTAFAAIIYVDNTQGSDAFDGRSKLPTGGGTGPTLSLRRALELARGGDTIVIANTGRPYRESVSLVGRRHSGIIGRPFAIIGNGAVLDGSAAVHPKAWRFVGGNVWRMTPWRKGFFQLILDDKPVPEHRPANAADERPAIPTGKWMAWKGSIYYQAAEKEDPRDKAFRYAARSVGITLYEASDVQVTNLTVRYFRLDGVNAHDRSLRIELDRVSALDNGRSGIAIGGSSAVVIRNCVVKGNRRDSVLLTELGAAKIEKSALSKPPTLPKE